MKLLWKVTAFKLYLKGNCLFDLPESRIIVQCQVVQILLLDLSLIHTPGFSLVLQIILRLETFEAVYDFRHKPSHIQVTLFERLAIAVRENV